MIFVVSTDRLLSLAGLATTLAARQVESRYNSHAHFVTNSYVLILRQCGDPACPTPWCCLTPSCFRLCSIILTGELASQIGDEGQKLTQKSHIRHQVVFGGSSRPKDVSQFERQVPTILVATPGRLRDHLDNTTVRGKPFRQLFQKTSILVLDETDRYVQ